MGIPSFKSELLLKFCRVKSSFSFFEFSSFTVFFSFGTISFSCCIILSIFSLIFSCFTESNFSFWSWIRLFSSSSICFSTSFSSFCNSTFFVLSSPFVWFSCFLSLFSSLSTWSLIWIYSLKSLGFSSLLFFILKFVFSTFSLFSNTPLSIGISSLLPLLISLSFILAL